MYMYSKWMNEWFNYDKNIIKMIKLQEASPLLEVEKMWSVWADFFLAFIPPFMAMSQLRKIVYQCIYIYMCLKGGATTVAPKGGESMSAACNQWTTPLLLPEEFKLYFAFVAVGFVIATSKVNSLSSLCTNINTCCLSLSPGNITYQE